MTEVDSESEIKNVDEVVSENEKSVDEFIKVTQSQHEPGILDKAVDVIHNVVENVVDGVHSLKEAAENQLKHVASVSQGVFHHASETAEETFQKANEMVNMELASDAAIDDTAEDDSVLVKRAGSMNSRDQTFESEEDEIQKKLG
jgi:hypothetical protein